MLILHSAVAWVPLGSESATARPGVVVFLVAFESISCGRNFRERKDWKLGSGAKPRGNFCFCRFLSFLQPRKHRKTTPRRSARSLVNFRSISCTLHQFRGASSFARSEGRCSLFIMDALQKCGTPAGPRLQSNQSQCALEVSLGRT